jgi:hypothetical protein
VVGEEHVNFAGFGVLVNDAAHGFGALSGFGAGKPDGLIGDQAQGRLKVRGGRPVPCSRSGLEK